MKVMHWAGAVTLASVVAGCAGSDSAPPPPPPPPSVAAGSGNDHRDRFADAQRCVDGRKRILRPAGDGRDPIPAASNMTARRSLRSN